MDTVTALVGEHAAQRGASPAVIYQGSTLSYRELDTLGRRAARGLARLGVGRGDRVALWLPNTPAYLALWLGCARLGAIAVAVNTRFRGVEVADIIARSGARALAIWPGFRSIDFLSILAEVDSAALTRLETIVLYDEGKPGNEVPDAIAQCERVRYAQLIENAPLEADHAAPGLGSNIFTTSGTTRAPKFVLHSHASVTRHARTVAREYGYRGSAGGVLQALPLCGVFGFCQASAGLASGRPLLMTSAFDAEEAVRLVEEHQVEYLNGTDDMLEAMMDVSPHEVAFPSVKCSGFAAFAAEPEAFMERAESRGLKLVGLYGMSEVQAFFARQPLEANAEIRRLGGGVPLDPEAQARVCDPDDGRELPHGEHGEIQLKGPSRMLEYFENAEATAAAITADGFLRSGDLGYMADDRRFVYLARMGDVLRLGGFLVSPAEIEAHLNEHPVVRGTQVVGVTTDHGPRPVGFVTLHPGQPFEEAALRAHCQAGLAKFKVPVRIIELDEFPTTKSANGTKIQKARLRELAERALAAG